MSATIGGTSTPAAGWRCPWCTFRNHEDLVDCEVCRAKRKPRVATQVTNILDLCRDRRGSFSVPPAVNNTSAPPKKRGYSSTATGGSCCGDHTSSLGTTHGGDDEWMPAAAPKPTRGAGQAAPNIEHSRQRRRIKTSVEETPPRRRSHTIYSCPKCNQVVSHRDVTACTHCGALLKQAVDGAPSALRTVTRHLPAKHHSSRRTAGVNRFKLDGDGDDKDENQEVTSDQQPSEDNESLLSESQFARNSNMPVALIDAKGGRGFPPAPHTAARKPLFQKINPPPTQAQHSLMRRCYEEFGDKHRAMPLCVLTCLQCGEVLDENLRKDTLLVALLADFYKAETFPTVPCEFCGDPQVLRDHNLDAVRAIVDMALSPDLSLPGVCPPPPQPPDPPPTDGFLLDEDDGDEPPAPADVSAPPGFTANAASPPSTWSQDDLPPGLALPSRAPRASQSSSSSSESASSFSASSTISDDDESSSSGVSSANVGRAQRLSATPDLSYRRSYHHSPDTLTRQKLFDFFVRCHIVLVMGLPASGKSVIAKRLHRYGAYEVISEHDREHLIPQLNTLDLLIRQVQRRFRRCWGARAVNAPVPLPRVVIDYPNLRKKDRAKWLNVLTDRDVPAYRYGCIILNQDPDVCILRRSNSGKVSPADAKTEVRDALRAWQPLTEFPRDSMLKIENGTQMRALKGFIEDCVPNFIDIF